MRDIVLYAYTHDVTLKDWLKFLVSEGNAKISICSDEKKLHELYEKEFPDILLIDEDEDESGVHTQKFIDEFVPKKNRGASMLVVLSSKASSLEYRVNLLLNEVDYIIEKPLNMMEIIARLTAMVRHQRYVQERISDYVTQTKDIATFDTMDRIMVYLKDHIKPIIQRHIDFGESEDADISKKDLVELLREEGMEVMASLNAIKDDIHGLISTKKEGRGASYDHLEELFKKNFDLLHLAYDGYREKGKKEGNNG